jgi:nicotinate-nucleotide adenylyltransferase
MRLGIFGGTFNPIHIAHLRCAEEARAALRLERVLFVPTASPPHKRGREIAPAADRLSMVRLAIRGNPAFRVSSIELDRPGRSYSVDTLRILREHMPRKTRLVFLVGLDAFREINTWKDFPALFTLTDFAVFARPPESLALPQRLLPVAVRKQFCYRKSINTLVHSSGNQVHFLKVTALDISASAIRRNVKNGRPIRYLVPAAVESYIRGHDLYARHADNLDCA